jgi:peptidoglycan/xylan/chitin deacetylase (PgdA/CDA1 family)
MCSWDDLRALHAAGFEIGAHSHTHRRVAQLPTDEALHEIAEPKRLLERALGAAVRSYAYPKGHADAFSPATRRMLAECGYWAGCTQMGGRLMSSADLLELPRIGTTRVDRLPRLIRKIRGAHDLFASRAPRGSER